MTTLPGDGEQLNAKASGSHSFTPEQVRYMGSLPAVSTVGPNRIRYEIRWVTVEFWARRHDNPPPRVHCTRPNKPRSHSAA